MTVRVLRVSEFTMSYHTENVHWLETGSSPGPDQTGPSPAGSFGLVG